MSEAADNDALIALAEAGRKKGVLVVAFANHAYLEVLLNWLVAMNRLERASVLLVSLDEELHDYLSKRDIPSVLSPLEGGLDRLWVKRIRIFRQLIDHGISFVHSDTDAIWLRDPIPAYFADPGHDLIISQGTIWPPDVVAKRGFVFCCGLFHLRSSEAVQGLLAELEDDVGTTGDDQITLNRVIESYGIEWDINRRHLYGLKCRGTPFLCSRRPITGRATTNALSVCLLPHHEFQRLHMPDEDAYVKHLLSPKTASNKLDLFRKSDSFFLRANWRDLDFDAGSIEKLAAAR